jgi:hypothetical protein
LAAAHSWYCTLYTIADCRQRQLPLQADDAIFASPVLRLID